MGKKRSIELSRNLYQESAVEKLKIVPDTYYTFDGLLYYVTVVQFFPGSPRALQN